MKKRANLLIAILSLMALTSCETFNTSSISSDISTSQTSDSSRDSSSSGSSSSKGESSTSIDYPDTDTRWNVNFNKYGISFRNELGNLIMAKKRKTCSYNDCLSIGAKAAAYPNSSSSTFVAFYHKAPTVTTTGQCNREHTWPNSRGSGKSGPGSDPFIIRPTLNADNSARGNSFYGLGSNEWDPASIEFEGARGESARVALYAATAYGQSHGFGLSNNPSDPTSAKTMGTLKTLLKWNLQYPVTNIEKQINDYLDKNGYGRNPFVDHPEYASFIWDEKGLLTSSPTGGGSIDDGGDEEPNYSYTLFNNLNSLSGKSLAVVTSDSANYYALTSETKSSSLPWYLVGQMINTNADQTKMEPNGQLQTSWKFEKQADGTYTIYDESSRCYLYSYISGTHYSICVDESVDTGTSKYWNITKSGSGFTFKSSLNVYLEYYKGSYCGYNNNPNTPILLYERA